MKNTKYLSACAVKIYEFLVPWWLLYDDVCELSNDELAELLGYKKRTICLAITELYELEMATFTRHDRKRQIRKVKGC